MSAEYDLPCELCNKPILKIEAAAYPCTGWEMPRGAGGANYIKGRKRIPNRMAHALCVDKHFKFGGDQQSMFA